MVADASDAQGSAPREPQQPHAAEQRADVREPILQIKHLDVSFERHPVLRDLNLEVYRGEKLAIIGESGCGKTVLLKTLIGLVRPTRGQVVFDGRSLTDLSEQELTQLRVRFGFVFQQAALFDSMTIGQNVAFPLRQHRTTDAKEIQRIVREALSAVGLPESVIGKRPAELSGGMRKRVGLARALVMNPELLLYDEPTTGLDPIMSDIIDQLILQTSRRANVTSVIVTHDMSSVRKVADRVVMLFPLSRLRPGQSQILYDGPPQGLESAADSRVIQFVRGQAGQRLMELAQNGV